MGCVRFIYRRWSYAIDHRTEIEKLTFRALALRQSESRNCGLCKVYIQKMELRYRWKLGHVKNGNVRLCTAKYDHAWLRTAI